MPVDNAAGTGRDEGIIAPVLPTSTSAGHRVRGRGGARALAAVVAVAVTAGCGGVPAEAPRTLPTQSAIDTSAPVPADAPDAVDAAAADAPEAADAARAARARALGVLRQWDDRRAAAFAAADLTALRELYPEGSPLAAQDLRVLRRWSRRGVGLAEVRPQVVSVRIRTSARDVVAVTVVERATARAVLAGPGTEQRPLAASRFVRRHLRFVRARPDGWWLSSARGA